MGGGVGARVGSVRWGEGGMLSLWNIDRNTVFVSVSFTAAGEWCLSYPAGF